jgi:hypothetical protein
MSNNEFASNFAEASTSGQFGIRRTRLTLPSRERMLVGCSTWPAVASMSATLRFKATWCWSLRCGAWRVDIAPCVGNRRRRCRVCPRARRRDIPQERLFLEQSWGPRCAYPNNRHALTLESQNGGVLFSESGSQSFHACVFWDNRAWVWDRSLGRRDDQTLRVIGRRRGCKLFAICRRPCAIRTLQFFAELGPGRTRSTRPSPSPWRVERSGRAGKWGRALLGRERDKDCELDIHREQRDGQRTCLRLRLFANRCMQSSGGAISVTSEASMQLQWSVFTRNLAQVSLSRDGE